jgi:hypothetical protein
MSDSITLRKLLGLSAAPARLSESALIMVDCQNTYREGLMQLVGVEPALAQCATLLARARKLGIPIFHIQHDAGVGTPYDITHPIGQLPRVAEPQIKNAAFSRYPPPYPGSARWSDALIHQPFGQIRVVGRALAADADVLAHLVGGGRWPSPAAS